VELDWARLRQDDKGLEAASFKSPRPVTRQQPEPVLEPSGVRTPRRANERCCLGDGRPGLLSPWAVDSVLCTRSTRDQRRGVAGPATRARSGRWRGSWASRGRKRGGAGSKVPADGQCQAWNEV